MKLKSVRFFTATSKSIDTFRKNSAHPEFQTNARQFMPIFFHVKIIVDAQNNYSITLNSAK